MLFHSGDLNEPLCVTAQHFCVVELGSAEIVAFYTYDTHLASRERSCDIAWMPEFSFVDPDTGESTLGWFRSGCSGTTYRMNGERALGPGLRDMDRFSVKERSCEVHFEGRTEAIEYLEVDTRSLICGEASPGAPKDCEWAPLPQ